MGFKIVGKVVELERKPWEIGGKTGISYNVYVAGGRARDGAQCVKVAPEQFGTFSEGQDVDLPVLVSAQGSDYGGAARVVVKLDPEYTRAAAARPAAPRAVASV